MRQLREAIDRRAAHGLNRITFAAEGQPGTADGEAALTRSALRLSVAPHPVCWLRMGPVRITGTG